jgi:hypothetical protein
MLKELKIPYNIYDENGAFESMKLLIVPDADGHDEALVKRLKAYVQAGGKVIFAGSALELGKQADLLDYVELLGKDSADNAYYTVAGSNMRWAMYEPSCIVKNVSGEEKARYVKNVMNFTWDGRQSCYYRPQGEVTDYSAAVIKGNTACICFDIFKAYADNFLVEHRELMEGLIDQLLPDRAILAPRMAKTATVSLTDNGTHTVFHVKATYAEHKMCRGIIEEHGFMPGAEVSLAGEHEIFVLPEMTILYGSLLVKRTVSPIM